MSARAKTPTSRGTPPAPEQQPSRRLSTGGFRPMRPSQENLKTEIFDTEGFSQGKSGGVPQDSIAAPIDRSVSLVVHSRMNDGVSGDSFAREVATPIKAISMKTPAAERPALDPELDERRPRVKLRAMSEVGGTQKQQDLGRLAPPRDPTAAAARRRQDYLVWGSVSVIVASVVALIIWFLGR